MRQHVQNPCVVGVAFRRCAIVNPTGIVGQVGIIPALQVKRRVGHDVVEIQALVQVVGKGRVIGFTQVVADTAQRKVHLGQTVRCAVLLLTVNVDAADIAALRLHQLCALYKHPTRTTTGIIERAIKGLNHGRNQLHDVMRRIVFAFLLGCIDRKLLEEVLVYTTDQVFLYAKGLVRDLIDFIHKLLDVVRSKIARRKGAFDKAAFELVAAGSNAVQCCIQRNI